MTKEENIKNIAGVLDNMGIDSNVILEELFNKVNSGIPVFNILYKCSFEGEAMEYYLHFKRDLQSGDYHADNYTSVYKNKNVDLKRGTVNNIDLPALENEMGAVDWERFFSSDTATLNKTEIAKVEKILGKLDGLRTGRDLAGLQLYVGLLFKHFPESVWPPVVKEQSRNRVRTDLVNIVNDPSHRIRSDYFALSGKLDKYFKAMLPLEFHSLYRYNFREYLKWHLGTKGPETPLSLTLNTEKGAFRIITSLHDQAKAYKSGSYEISFYPFKPLPDVTISYVSIHELDRLFKNTNWQNEFIHGGEASEKAFASRLKLIEDYLGVLSTSELGKSLSYQLQLIHWAGCSKFQDKINPEAWDVLHKETATFPGYIPVSDAIKVMSGNAFLFSYEPEFNKGFDKWPQVPIAIGDGKKKVYISFPDFVAKQIDNTKTLPKRIFVSDKNKSCNTKQLLIVGDALITRVPNEEDRILVKVPLLSKDVIQWDLPAGKQKMDTHVKVNWEQPVKKKKGKRLGL